MDLADEDAFVRARGDHFLRLAVMLAGSPAEGEDLLQASLVRLYQAWPPARQVYDSGGVHAEFTWAGTN